jgi:hypothetical protein
MKRFAFTAAVLLAVAGAATTPPPAPQVEPAPTFYGVCPTPATNCAGVLPADQLIGVTP